MNTRTQKGSIHILLLLTLVIASVVAIPVGVSAVLRGQVGPSTPAGEVLHEEQGDTLGESREAEETEEAPEVEQEFTQPEVERNWGVVENTQPEEVYNPTPQSDDYFDDSGYKDYQENTTQTVVIEQPKVDPAVAIEICRSQAKEKRKEEERKINEEYAQSEPAMVELAAAQNNGQTEAIALKYGYITEEDIVRIADEFTELINEGYPIDIAQSMAESAHSAYSAYLRSLHDWATNELDKWTSVVETRFDTYENEVYQRCLSSL